VGSHPVSRQGVATRRVLYVEDNLENRILIKRVLEAEGYVVDEAADGLSGIKRAVENRPDLILLDINLPDIDGYEATIRLRKIDGVNGVPIVALTANVMQGDREKSLEAGCDGYIQKPIDVDQLPDQIESYLGDGHGPQGGTSERQRVIR
jgi:two-component system cell cycle response regulator DivK